MQIYVCMQAETDRNVQAECPMVWLHAIPVSNYNMHKVIEQFKRHLVKQTGFFFSIVESKIQDTFLYHLNERQRAASEL